MEEITLRPIGILRTPHVDPAKTPLQPAYAQGIRGRVEILPEFAEGLVGLEGFSHVVLIYRLHEAGETRLTVVPFLADTPQGVFATRHPARPNGLGLSVVRLVAREGTTLHVEGVDMLDETPLLDVKPWVPGFEPTADSDDVRIGWLADVDEATARTRGRRE